VNVWRAYFIHQVLYNDLHFIILHTTNVTAVSFYSIPIRPILYERVKYWTLLVSISLCQIHSKKAACGNHFSVYNGVRRPYSRLPFGSVCPGILSARYDCPCISTRMPCIRHRLWYHRRGWVLLVRSVSKRKSAVNAWHLFVYRVLLLLLLTCLVIVALRPVEKKEGWMDARLPTACRIRSYHKVVVEESASLSSFAGIDHGCCCCSNKC